MSFADRENIDRKLVELVKPHEVLYNGKTSSTDYSATRAQVWNEICTEMNSIFNLNRYVDEWKTRWLALRSSYRQGIQIKVNRRSNVCDDMEFLRPYTHVSAKSGRKNYRKGAKQKIKKEKHIAKTSKHIKREKHRPLKLHTNGDYENNSLAYNDSSYRMVKNETIEPNNECFEIILPDDDEAAINDELSVNTENRLQSDPFDEDLEDSDGAFGILITRELREMEPAAKREFKRTVMQLLYS